MFSDIGSVETIASSVNLRPPESVPGVLPVTRLTSAGFGGLPTIIKSPLFAILFISWKKKVECSQCFFIFLYF
jgi:hypothetical protein